MNGLEEQTAGKLLVIRLNVQEPVARELAPVYEFQFTPTFIFFDAQGNELWRSIGELDVEQVLNSLLIE